ncbi:opioid growth factor receptor-like isoform X1 [Bufo bufo]|uniref:opioid growth factor receptor-like isoform X1 n=1 Tax=Bufo bufo TaxID=8384 RepID=UPI001ABE008B|nr:opioid growth factor receptor-like isoform X1 [Bufo bufo]
MVTTFCHTNSADNIHSHAVSSRRLWKLEGGAGSGAAEILKMEKTSNLTPNLDFYRNKKPFKPNGVYIEVLLSDWKRDYDRLERNHSYIQWLFPLQKPGTNSSAKPLTMNEIQIMKSDQEVRSRFLAAYKLMLGFYGIKLLDLETGKVTKAENWKERFHNLNNYSHNNLRITRILKCLGEMGYEHFQAPLVRFFLEETMCNNNLPNVKRSVLDYFMFTVKDKQERAKLMTLLERIKNPTNHLSGDQWRSSEATEMGMELGVQGREESTSRKRR